MKLRWIGFSFMIQGLIEFVIAKYSCESLCPSCSFEQLKPCFFLLIFVGIIFVVVGLSILTLRETKVPKIKVRGKKDRW